LDQIIKKIGNHVKDRQSCCAVAVSLGSLVAAAVLPVWVWLDRGVSPVFDASVIIAVFIAWSHRANIQRLRAGTESSIRRNKGTPE